MATLLPIDEIIEIGKVSTYLSANYQSKSALYGGNVIKPTPAVQIAWVTDALEWGYLGGAQTDASLRNTANYLYWLCGQFQLQAQNIISGSGGGSVIPTPSGGSSVNALDFEVSDTSPIPTGGSTIMLDGTNGNPDYRGFKVVNFSRGGLWQNTTNLGDGSSRYAWNSVTGAFSAYPAATAGELFRITPDATGGVVATSSASTWRRIVVTSADFDGDGVTLNNATIAGSNYTLTVIGFNQEPQFAGSFFDYTETGFVIIWPDFDAANFGNIIIDKID